MTTGMDGAARQDGRSSTIDLSGNGLPALLARALGLDPAATPFPWQIRLLDSFLGGTIPRSLDIPTGLGKTASMAIWLVARALGAKLPRRLVYIVDRRAVVDQATEEALRLRNWVAGEAAVRTRLLPDGGSLAISTLRGQFVDNREWLEDPALPAIVVGTVDMVGSRLLFEGYATSRKMRPYHAALLGCDSLLVLDEAHLVPAFERLLERITHAGADLGPAPETVVLRSPTPSLLSLSATGQSRGGEPFELDDADLTHDVVCRRLDAPKRLSILELTGKEELAVVAAQRAWELAEQGARPIRCIVFTTKREDAEKAMSVLAGLAGLDSLKKGGQAAADLELLVGGRRVFERTGAAERLRTLGFLAKSDVPRCRPAFVFATSAGEVGIDLDADHLVCDLVAWERMVQRLGRVNRRGRGDALVQVLAEPLPEPSEPRVVAERQALRALLERLPSLADGAHDASPGALRALQRAARHDDELARLLEQASTPAPLCPRLDRPTLDAWSMTSLQRHPGRPLVAPWLRGWIEDRPQTTVIWRTNLPVRAGRSFVSGEVERFFAAAPPHPSEWLETECFRVAEWLNKRAKRLLRQAEKSSPESRGQLLGRDDVVAITLPRGEEDSRAWTLQKLLDLPKNELVSRVLPGATLVLDARVAGLSHGLLDGDQDDLVPTADGPTWLGSPADGSAPPVPFRVRVTSEQGAIQDRVWRERDRLPLDRGADGVVTSWLVVQKWRHDGSTEDDRSAGRPQLLDEHQSWTVRRVRGLAERLELSPDAAGLLALAARLHDEGKRARRWQTAFHAAAGGAAWAKTRGPVNVHLLDGYRHEFGSLLAAERDEELAALPADQRDLVLHLIASHHGFARPVIGTRGCEAAPPSRLEEQARQVALRFIRLQQQCGPWGLAWWETLLRASDQQASRQNDAEDAASPAQERS